MDSTADTFSGKRVMPKQNRATSRQDYGTPPVFLQAVVDLLGIASFDIDLAASGDNAVTQPYYTEADNSLVQPWRVGDGWNWLNPPFGNIRPWVEKAVCEAIYCGAKTAVLIPASVGSNWWYDWVDGSAYVHFLNGRLTFVGEATCYPKDCALLLYAPFLCGGSNIWSWNRGNHE